MKKLLLNFFVVIAAALFADTVSAQTISYAPTNPYTTGTAMSLSPSVTGVGSTVLTYGTGVALPTANPVLNKPWGMAIDPSGNIYAVNNTGNTVSRWTSAGVAGTAFIQATPTPPTLTAPTGITFDGSGNAYIVRSSGVIYKYSSSGTYISTIVATGSGTTYGIVSDAAGNLYYTDYQNGTVRKYTAASNTSAILVNLGGAYGPSGISIDNNGNIYTVEVYNTAKVIKKYNSAGTLIQTITPSTALSAPYGLYVDGSGNIYVGDNGTGTTTGKVYVYNAAGTLLATINTGGNPRGLVTDAKGNLYVSDNTNSTVTKYPPTAGYYISAPLPPGLSFSTTTGVISGTPTVAYSGNYTVTVYNGASSATSAQFTITCTAPPAPALTYGTPNTYTVGVAIPTLTPSNSGGAPTSVTISPAIPGGLAISTTGVITGTPTAAQTATNYVVTATNSGGSAASNTFSITIYPPVPSVSYTGSPFSFNTGTPIANLTPATTNSPTNFTISPNLTTNTGLSFNASTGVISGTPTIASPATPYTITATNANPTGGTTTISITTVVPAPPVVSYSPASYTFVVGTAGATSAITNSGGTATYAMDATTPLPSYLSLNTSTGVISCSTSGVVTAATIYKVVATNGGGSNTASITITVNPAAPSITYSPNTYTFTTGVSGSTSAATNSGGPATYSFDPSTPAPAYLTINTSTGVITASTASVATSATSYKINATNATSTSSATVTISIVSPPAFTYTTPNNYVVGTTIPTLGPTPAAGGGTVATLGYGTGSPYSPTLLKKPYQMAFDSNGNLFVVDYNSGNVTEYPSGSTTGTNVITGLTNPQAIAIDANNNIYIGALSGSITKYNASFAAQPFTAGTAPSSVYGMDTDAAGNLYVADNTKGYVTKFSPTGTVLLNITYNGNGSGYIYDPVGVQVDAAGNIYTIDVSTNLIAKFTPAGVYSSTIVTGIANGYGFYMDGGGNFFVGSTSTGAVREYSSSGSLLTTVTPATGSAPRGVITDAQGNLYIDDYTANVLYKYPPVGGYYINNPLPPGLVFNANTGAITGNPTTVFSGTYIVTAYNAGGKGTSNTFTINCNPPAPILAYTGTPYSGTTGITNFAITITNTGGAVSGAYTFTPTSGTLPSGITFSTSTGGFTGTPTVAGTVTGTVSAGNATGTSSANITITVTDPPAPVLSFSPSFYSFNPGTAITPFSVINTGGAVPGYSITSGTLPNGLTFAPSTGTISGTPTTVASAVVITVTGTNVTGTSSANVTITITGNPPAINYNPNSYTFNAGTAIPSTIIPNSTGGAVATGFGYGPGSIILNQPLNNLSNPYGITTDAAGNVYVVNFTGNTVTEYSTTGVISTFASGASLSGPVGIVFDSSGAAYILNQTSQTVVKYSGGTYTTIITSANGLNSPLGIAIDGSNRLYIANSGNNTITKYTTSGSTPVQTITSNAAYAISGGIDVDGSGNIYVIDNSGGSYVDEYNSAGTRILVKYIDGTSAGSALSLDGAGNIYVSNTNNSTVTVYSPPSLGSTLTTITASSNMRGLVTDNNGNLYVSDYTANTVTRYAQVAGYRLTGTLPTGLAFNTSTGQFTGTPTAAFPAVTLTVTAYNSSGSGSTTITFTCNPAILPAISYTPNTYVLAVNNPAPATIIPNNSGSAITTPPSYSGTPTQILSGLTGPWGMTTDPSGNVYVVTNNAGGVGTITEYSNTGAITTFGTGGSISAMAGIVFDATGTNAYVLSQTGTGTVYKYTNGAYVGPVISTGLSTPTGITIDGSGNLYIANSGNNTITKYSTSPSVTLTQTVTALSGDVVTGGVAVDASGNIYFGDGNYVDEYNAAGTTAVNYINTNTTVYQISINSSNNAFAADNTKFVYTNSTGRYTTSLPFTSARGITTDNVGNLYVADYSAGIVYKYAPVAGYYLTGPPLPAGLAFNNNTGQITGTPTAIFPATTFTVTGYNAYGSSSTPLTLSCAVPNNWVGTNAASSDWNTGANWSTGTVPSSTDIAYIGASRTWSFSVIPTVSGTVTVGAVVMGTSNANSSYVAPGINITGSLTVTGSLTDQNDQYTVAANAVSPTLTGAGSLIVGSMIVNNSNYTPATAGTATTTYASTITSSVSSLTINGNLSLTTNSYNGTTKLYNATVSITGGTVLLKGIVQTVNTAPNNAIATLSVSGATLQLANTTPLSGLSTTGVNTLSFKNTGATIEYSGAAQTVYTDAAITGLTTGPSYQNIKFSGTGIKTPNGTSTNNLNIAGDFTNTLTNDASNYVNLSNTLAVFNGAAQNIAGGPGATAAAPAASGNGTVFKSISYTTAGAKTINSGVVHITSTGSLILSTSTAPVLTVAAAGNLTLNSDIYGSAIVTVLSGGAVVNGSVDVQRYLSGGSTTYRGYRLLSSPVNAGGNNVSINYIQKSSYVTGTTGTSGGFDAAPVNNPTLYLFRENLVPSNQTFTGGNYRGINNITAAPSYAMDIDGSGFNIPIGNGYLFFFRGDRNVGVPLASQNSSYAPTATTLTATGKLNQGSITFNTWYNSSGGTPAVNFTNLLYSTTSGMSGIIGFNLVGNPYASSIDWDKSTSNSGTGIQTANVGPFIYILDPVSKNYNVYKAGQGGVGNIASSNSNIISSGQGFFVVASGNTATLQFNESAKSNTQVSNANGNLFMGTPPVLAAIPSMHMTMTKDSITEDGIFINFNNNAKAQYVLNEDAPHKVGFGVSSLASRSTDNVTLAYNTLPFPKQGQIIPLSVGAASDGIYRFNMKAIANIPAIYEIWLKDAYTKDSLDIRNNPNYAFNVVRADTASYGDNRFSLVIRQNPALALHLLSFTGSKITLGNQVTWHVENEQNYTNFTVERSIDNGATYQVLGGMVSDAQGTYSFNDKSPSIATNNMYKLKLEDLNGTISYSGVVIIGYANLANSHTGINVYPNPTANVINMAVIDDNGITGQTLNTTASNSAAYSIKIVNVNGAVVQTAKSATTNWQANVTNLTPGSYIIQVTNTTTNKIVGKSTFVKL